MDKVILKVKSGIVCLSLLALFTGCVGSKIGPAMNQVLPSLGDGLSPTPSVNTTPTPVSSPGMSPSPTPRVSPTPTPRVSPSPTPIVMNCSWSQVHRFDEGFMPLKISTDKLNNVFVAGQLSSSGLVKTHGVVYKSTDAGVSFTKIDDFFYDPSGTGSGTLSTDAMMDSSGQIFVIGFAYFNNSGSEKVFIRKRSTTGVWTTTYFTRGGTGGYYFMHDRANLIQLSTGTIIAGYENLNITLKKYNGTSWVALSSFSGSYRSMTVDSSDNLYIVGGENIRKSTDRGATWNIVHTLHDQYWTIFYGVTTDEQNNAYVVGTSYTQDFKNYKWIITKGTPGGSWSDSFIASGGSLDVTYSLSLKSLFSVGVGYLNYPQMGQGGVLKSSDRGATWQQSDPTMNQYAEWFSIASDTLGNVYRADSNDSNLSKYSCK